MTAERFVSAARTLLGVRWRHRGRKPWALDCVGLVLLAARQAGREEPDVLGYGREPWEDRLRAELRRRCGDPVTDWRPGDIALIRWRPGEPSHVAILGDHPDSGLSLIHVHNLHGVVEHALRDRYLACVVEVYRPWP